MRFQITLAALLCVCGAFASALLPRSYQAVVKDMADIRSQLDHIKKDAVAVVPRRGTDQQARQLIDGVDSLGAAFATAADEINRTQFNSGEQYQYVWDNSRALEAPTTAALNEIIKKADSFDAFKIIPGPFPVLMTKKLKTLAQKAKSFDDAAVKVVPADAPSSIVGYKVLDAVESLKGVCKRLNIRCD